jgi:hypothetical protein
MRGPLSTAQLPHARSHAFPSTLDISSRLDKVYINGHSGEIKIGDLGLVVLAPQRFGPGAACWALPLPFQRVAHLHAAVVQLAAVHKCHTWGSCVPLVCVRRGTSIVTSNAASLLRLLRHYMCHAETLLARPLLVRSDTAPCCLACCYYYPEVQLYPSPLVPAPHTHAPLPSAQV